MRTRNHVFSILLAMMLIVTLAAGCKSSGQKQQSKAVDSLATLRDETIKGKEQLEATMASLNTLVATTSGDLKKPYNDFKKEFGRLQSSADKARSRSADMAKRAAAYTERWEKELAAMTNEEIRARAEEAQARAQARFAEIREDVDRTRETFARLMQDLTDIQSYLDFNLNAEGVASIADIVTRANEDAAAVGAALDETITLLDAIEAGMSSRMN